MRTQALLAVLLVMGAAFAGCVGQVTEPGDDGQTSPDGTVPAATEGEVAVPPAEGLKVLAPLATTVKTEAPAWIASGTKINVSASAPSNAKGDVTYTWAVGPLPGTVAVTEAALDTKSIAAGATGKLTFTDAGVYGIHCHPHPFMLGNVTVIDGYAGPNEAVVYIVDGATLGEYRFVPEHVVIPAGGSVLYKNVGAQMHTATQAGQEPALKLGDLAAASGEITVEGTGWQRVVVLVQDSEGRIGRSEHHVYVNPLPENYANTLSGEFRLGVPAAAPKEITEIKTESFKLEYPGVITLNYSANDATGQGLGQVEIHLREQGATQDTLTADASDSGTLTGRVGAKTYELVIIPRQGAVVTYEVSIDVVYDLMPPAPAEAGASAGGHGDHGGHAGH